MKDLTLFLALLLMLSCQTVKVTEDNLTSAEEESWIIISGISISREGSIGDGEHVDLMIAGRKVIHRDFSMIKKATDEDGILTCKVCINREGIVTYVEVETSETTISDKSIWDRGMKSLMRYKYEPNPNASDEQCGKYTLKVVTH